MKRAWWGLALGAALLANGVALALAHSGGGIGFIVLGVAVIVSVLVERRYRRPDSQPLPPGFEPTTETFRDDESGQWLRVYYNPRTGERLYRPEG